jgi:predicted phage replisome organizer
MASDVKWIKICTDIFDDEKILLIESIPEADAIIVIWFKLLCLAGKQNNRGVFMMNDKIAYTDEMLSTIFRKPINIVRLALRTFEQFRMIELINNVITIPNWEKHQNIEGMEKIKEQNRLRKQRERERKKLVLCDSNVTVTQCHATDRDIEEEIDIEKENISIKKEKPVKHKYGEYKNVLLSDEDMEKLKNEFPSDFQERIERLSCYKESTGKSYKNDLATIRNWARKDTKPQEEPTRYGGTYL